ncbi:hypothetical protein [Changchengzhania lutea]|uniref:hypothetical protein n=1 Tax=Changchengzhania lutea TaxID=2049305 RepID=UPI00115F6378|nr:hypothetical protein [Changchengzhania lutea]
MELVTHPTLADSICDIRSRKIKRTFFTQINTLLDWQSIIKVINKHYSKGKVPQESQLQWFTAF